MINYLFTNPLFFFIWLISLLTAITIHEFAHAWMAVRLGDPTPKLQGRLTLNPAAHLDPMGTLMLLLIRFGWGKPVQFDPYNLANPKRDSALISLAGPAINLFAAVILSIVLRIASAPFSPFALFSHLITPFIYLNVVLAIFNLVPIHPLDGGKILVGLLPRKDAIKVDQFLNRYGLILLLLMVFPIFGATSPILQVISPIVNFILAILLPQTTIV
jgi:Zn-dependent protease